MGTFHNVVITICILSFLVFVAFFGRLPIFRSTPISFIYRSIWIYIPKGARNIDSIVTGGRLTIYLARFLHYLFYQKNPIILILYMVLLTGSSTCFLQAAWARLAPLPHHALIPIVLALPYILTYLCVTSQQSLITPKTHDKHLGTYPFDYTLYNPRNICRTCHFEKPARSKHCSLCGTCIARADHHCAWVNNCVGASNYRWFLALLTSLGILLCYGAFLAYILMQENVESIFPNRPTPDLAYATTYDVNLNRSSRFSVLFVAMKRFVVATQLDFAIATVGLLAGLTAPLPWALLLYHIYLVWAGMTTNETGKWADLRADAQDGLLWKRAKRKSEVLMEHSRILGATNRRHRWPVIGDQVVLIAVEPPSEDEEESDDNDHDDDALIEEEQAWEQCWSLSDLENLYDAGMWGNVKDALHLL